MTNQKIFFSSNIRLLRARLHASQEEVATQLGISRNKLQALESGKTVNPTVADLVLFSGHFKMSIDSLLKIDLRKLGELKLRELEAGNDVYMTGTQLRVLAITVDKNNKEHREYVPIKAKAGYLSGYNDPAFIASLPKFSLPNLPRSGTFRMFPTTGDSMLPIPENSEIIAQYVEDWKALKPQTPCIVVLKGDQDFVFKLVTVQENKELLLQSLNPRYQPYAVPVNDIAELWKYHKHLTGTLPEKETGLQEIKKLIEDISNRLADKN